MPKRKSTDMTAMNLRLQESLRARIEAEAKKNGWSLNREMVRRLEHSFIQDELRQITAEMQRDIAIIGVALGVSKLKAKTRKAPTSKKDSDNG